MHIVCTKCTLVKSASSVHIVCIKFTSIHEKTLSSDPIWQSCRGRSWASMALKHGRLQDSTRHLTVLKYQRRGCTQTRSTTQQKRVPNKETRPTRFGSADVGAARLQRRPNYGRPPDPTSHLTLLKYQCCGCTITSTTTQQTWEL